MAKKIKNTCRMMIKRTKAAINYTTCYTLAAFFFSFLGSLFITEYLFEGLNGKYSKTSVSNIIKKHIGEKYSPHWMRHLAITHVINKNIPMPKAKLFSRHKSDSSIQFYYHYDNNTLNELRGVMSNMSA